MPYKISCGPFIPGELKGVDEDKRYTVKCYCNNKCPYWKLCWDDEGGLPTHQWKEFEATCDEVREGKSHRLFRGKYLIWKRIEV